MVKLFGYAADPIAKALQKKSGDLVVPPEGFYVAGRKVPYLKASWNVQPLGQGSYTQNKERNFETKSRRILSVAVSRMFFMSDARSVICTQGQTFLKCPRGLLQRG